MKGHKQDEIAAELGMNVKTVQREMKRAIERRWDDEIRERMQKTLMDAPDIHAEILNSDPEKLSKLSRGYKLKLDAANALANGLGAFKNESHSVKETYSLSAIAAETAPPTGAVTGGNADRPRIAFEPDTVDGDVVAVTEEPADE